MANAAFQTSPRLLGLYLAYKNPKLVADKISPYVPTSGHTFEYDEWSVPEMFTTVDDRVGRLSKPNQLTFSATRIPGACEDRALDSPVPRRDQKIADSERAVGGTYDPQTVATIGLAEVTKLNREARVINQVFDPAIYPTAQKVTLSGSSQWNDPASTPLIGITNALNAPLIRPNKMALDQLTWTNLRRHPQIVEAVLGTAANQGLVSREAVADLLEIDEIIVCDSKINTAKPGQAPIYNFLANRKSAMLFYSNSQAQLTGPIMTSFLTARFGSPIAGTILDPDIGAEGGIRVRAGEYAKELVLSTLGLYLFAQAIA